MYEVLYKNLITYRVFGLNLGKSSQIDYSLQNIQFLVVCEESRFHEGDLKKFFEKIFFEGSHHCLNIIVSYFILLFPKICIPKFLRKKHHYFYEPEYLFVWSPIVNIHWSIEILIKKIRRLIYCLFIYFMSHRKFQSTLISKTFQWFHESFTINSF